MLHMPMAVAWAGRSASFMHPSDPSIHWFVRLFLHTISQKLMQLGSTNLTQTWSTMSARNPFILGSKGYGSSFVRSFFAHMNPAYSAPQRWDLYIGLMRRSINLCWIYKES